MKDSFATFKQFVRQFILPAPADETLIITLFEPVSYRKGDVLVAMGTVAKHIYFINSGFLRVYHVEEGNEITNHLGGPNSFITTYLSFATRTPADESLIAITACDLLRITKNNMDRLYRESHNLAVFGLIMADQYLIFNNQRSRDLITLTAEQRYLKLLQQTPELVQNVPLHYVASYIGVKPESLSRIRRQLIS